MPKSRSIGPAFMHYPDDGWLNRSASGFDVRKKNPRQLINAALCLISKRASFCWQENH